MESETREIIGLDRLIHEPSRLAILTILRRTAGADYLFIRRLTGLSKGNLSNHLAKLEEAGLVDVGKHFEGKKTGHHGKAHAGWQGGHRRILERDAEDRGR